MVYPLQYSKGIATIYGVGQYSTTLNNIGNIMTTENKNTNTPENKNGEKEPIKVLPSIAKEGLPLETLLKNTAEFAKLANIHKVYLEDMGNKAIKEITGSTSVGNLLCISSGYAGGKYDSKNPASCFKFFAEQVNKGAKISDGVKAILSAFAKAEKANKPRPTFEVLDAVLDITKEDYTTAESMA